MSDKIVKTVTISLQGLNPVTIEGEKAKLHIEESNNHLKLYVPQDRGDREICFVKVLPDRLAAYLGIQKSGAVEVLGHLLQTSASILDQLLEEHGIVPLPWLEPVQQGAPSQEISESDEEDVGLPHQDLTSAEPCGSQRSTPERGRDAFQRTANAMPRPGSRTDSAYGRETEFSYGRSTFTPATFTGSLNTPRSSLTPAPPSVRLEAAPIQTLPNAEYVSLLNYVIAAAAAAVLQTLGLPPLAEQNEPIELSETSFGRRSENQIAHDIKVGAAGELYVCGQKHSFQFSYANYFHLRPSNFLVI